MAASKAAQRHPCTGLFELAEGDRILEERWLQSFWNNSVQGFDMIEVRQFAKS